VFIRYHPSAVLSKLINSKESMGTRITRITKDEHG
jgi:hypothetical protein